jgi:hypothetical protein
MVFSKQLAGIRAMRILLYVAVLVPLSLVQSVEEFRTLNQSIDFYTQNSYRSINAGCPCAKHMQASHDSEDDSTDDDTTTNSWDEDLEKQL